MNFIHYMSYRIIKLVTNLQWKIYFKSAFDKFSLFFCLWNTNQP